MSNEYLQGYFDKLNDKQKDFEEMHDRLESLEDDLRAKNTMLDDKNETIESLKADLDNVKKIMENLVDREEIEKVNNKYRKAKEKNNNL